MPSTRQVSIVRISDRNSESSPTLMIATMKVDAPSFVQPSAGKSVAESLAKLDETAARLDEIRSLFESVRGTDLKFPHPFFGEITAQEWLALKGGHEMRHLKQIGRLLEKIK